jgi:uncharacterized protein YdhG (YjbR/CyaY superfamily)
MAKTDFKSVSEYIAAKPRDAQAALKRVRGAIRKAVPAADEGIAYQIPVFKLNGVPVLFFAGWKKHFSLYPASDALVAAFKDELASCELSKGTIRFPLDEPVPEKLIERIARFRAKQLSERDKGKGSHKTGREAQLKRVRRICATMPSVWEKLSHGAPTFFVRKDKGVFTMFADNHLRLPLTPFSAPREDPPRRLVSQGGMLRSMLQVRPQQRRAPACPGREC